MNQTLNQKIKMRLRSYDYRVLDRAIHDILDIALRTGARVRGPVPLPQKKIKFTILRSPHIDKKARDQFERRVYNRLLEVYCTPMTLEALMGLVVPSEVQVEIKG